MSSYWVDKNYHWVIERLETGGLIQDGNAQRTLIRSTRRDILECMRAYNLGSKHYKPRKVLVKYELAK